MRYPLRESACLFISNVFCSFQVWNHWIRFKMTKKCWKWLKKVFQPFFRCCKHLKTGRNTQHNNYLWSFFAIRIFLFTFVYKPYKNKLWVFFTYLPHDIKWPQPLTTEFLVTKIFNLQLNFWFMVAGEYCQSKPKKFSWTN